MIGETLSHYRITGRLGAGGMGEVYRAEDTRLGREVALKVLPASMARDVTRLERFSREARAVAALNHPNIVTIHSVEEADGTHFLTMELVDGETLEQRVVDGGLPLTDLFAIAIPLADALRCAHDKGIVHRDLKPANVMITAEDRVKVLDFGLAKLQGGESNIAEAATVSRLLTQDGAVLGTYPYMSPEQVEGKHLDARTDLFSFGTIVYELATGSRPFDGDSQAALMSCILRDDPAGLADARPDLPRHFGRILTRCLQKDPRDRFQSARSIHNELKSLRTESTSATGAATSLATGHGVRYERSWIAVTDFKVSGASDELADFAEGLTEDITAGLSRFSYLSVVNRASTVSAAGQADNVQQLSEKLQARYLIEGSVRKAGLLMRVGVRLVDVRSGAHLWAETYTRSTEEFDIFSAQDDITGRVVATVADSYGVLARSLMQSIETKPDEELAPSEWLLRMFGYMMEMTPASHARLRTGLEAAVERYPRDADVWAALAQVTVNEWSFGSNPRENPLERALTAAERAVELDRGNQFAYQLLAQAHFFRQDIPRFRPIAERAVTLNPFDTNTLGMIGLLIAHTGDFARGAAMTRQAMELNPNHAGWVHFGEIWLRFSRGEFEEALDSASMINMPGMFWTLLVTASICGHLGRVREGEAAVDRLLELDSDIAYNVRQKVEAWHFTSGLLEPILEGLAKAGLVIPGKAAEAPVASASIGPQAATPEPGGARSPGTSAVAIAVLPFVDMSAAKDQAFFCEGMAEEIMNALMHVNGIRVASRMSAFRACEGQRDLADIGRTLAVGEVLEGSVRIAGDRLRVTAQLIDVESGYQLWSERYDRDASDVFAVQDEIAKSVVEIVQARLAPGAGHVSQRLQVKDLEAYRHYLKGRYYRYTRNDHANAVAEYQRAVELDPEYGPAWVGLAEGRTLAAGYGLIPAQQAYSEAREALARADELQGESAEALYVKGMIECSLRQWDAAYAALSRAASLRPDHVQSLCWLGFYYCMHQQADEGLAKLELACETDPLASYPPAMLGASLLQLCRDGEALAILERAVELDADNTLALWCLGMAQSVMGYQDDAVRTLHRAAEKARRSPLIVGILGWGLARAGRIDEAREALGELRGQGAPAVVSEAWILASLGESDAAWAVLERCMDECQMMFLFVGMPGIDPLRSDPRYEDLIRRIGLPLPPGRPEAEAAGAPVPSAPGNGTGALGAAMPASRDSNAEDPLPRSLAVLPLANLSGDPAQEFFVAGMHDALINELARIRALTVISRTSTTPFAGSTEPLGEIAGKLGVDAVIEGSVLKAGDQVRINLQLVNARPERHLWADSFDGALEDILGLHSRVAQALSSAVRARLTDDEAERLSTRRKVDPDVYEIYLRAKHLSYVSAEENVRGIRYYEEVVARDPDFAPAYAGLARNLVYLATLGAAPFQEVLPRAADAARRAVEMDPDSAEARSIHGYVSLFHGWDFETARRSLEQAREMEPNNVAALSDSILFLALTGAAEAAVLLAARAAELDPMSATTLFWKGWAQFVAEDYAPAIETFAQSLESDPGFSYPALWTGAAHGLAGRPAEARVWARKAEALDPASRNTDFLAVLGATYVMGNRPGDARRQLSRVESLEQGELSFHPQRSYIHGWLGEYDEAAELAELAFAERNPGVIFWANHPVCDASRAHPAIMAHLESLGFPVVRPMKPWVERPG